MALAPTHEFRIALDAPLEEALRRNHPEVKKLIGYDASPADRVVGERVAGAAAYWCDDTLWLVWGDEIIGLHGAGARRTFRLPDRGRVLAAINEVGATDYRLLPAHRLPQGDQLWFAWGYSSRGGPNEPTFFAVPVLFSPHIGGVWTAFAHNDDRRHRIGGTAIGGGVHLRGDGRGFVLTGEVDAGAVAHIDEFLPVAVAFVCDVVTGLWVHEKTRVPRQSADETRMLTAHRDAFLCDHKRSAATSIGWVVDPAGVVTGASYSHAPSPLREPLRLTGTYRGPAWDSRSRLVESGYDSSRAIALDYLDPSHLTVSLWSGLG